MTDHPNPTEDDLQMIAEQVWSSFLDPAGIYPLLPALPGDPVPSDVSAAVSVTGAWQGHVVINLTETASRHAAAALLGIELGEVTVADITDAVGELANIIGGNVKSLLPQPSVLSLPQVVTNAASTYWPAVVEVCQLTGVWIDEPVNVSVLESNVDYAGVSSS